FIRDSVLANEAGWVDVDDTTLQQRQFPNIFAIGDVTSTANAKTAAAVRKQAPIVAQNLLAHLQHQPLTAKYDGYDACPLTVERGKVVLAEFGYGGKLLPTFPLKPTVSSRFILKIISVWMTSMYFVSILIEREMYLVPEV